MSSRRNSFIKDFLLRGLVAMGFGPLVLAVVYLIVWLCESGVVIELPSVSLAILTLMVLAFICGGMTAIYQLESIPLPIKILTHGFVLYLSYAAIYLLNGWLGSGIVPFLVFTGIFVISYLLTWAVIFISQIISTKKLNRQIEQFSGQNE
jgi:hypothetical protein